MIWTPYQIELIVHHTVSSADFPRGSAPAYPGEIDELESRGILYRTTSGRIAATEKGRALVDMWSTTPLPVQVSKWVDPRIGEVRT